MNGFLLISVHNLDDIPVGLFATRSDALVCLKKRRARPPQRSPLGAWDQSGHLGWKLLQFKNGKPSGKAEILKWND